MDIPTIRRQISGVNLPIDPSSVPICEIKNEIPFPLTPCTDRVFKGVVIMVNENPLMMYFHPISWLIEGSNGIVYLLVSWRIKGMTLVFQLAVFALIATSSILLISVPVVFASPDGWSSNKNVIFSGTSLWIGLVFLVGILNSLIS